MSRRLKTFPRRQRLIGAGTELLVRAQVKGSTSRQRQRNCCFHIVAARGTHAACDHNLARRDAGYNDGKLNAAIPRGRIWSSNTVRIKATLTVSPNSRPRWFGSKSGHHRYAWDVGCACRQAEQTKWGDEQAVSPKNKSNAGYRSLARISTSAATSDR